MHPVKIQPCNRRHVVDDPVAGFAIARIDDLQGIRPRHRIIVPTVCRYDLIHPLDEPVQSDVGFELFNIIITGALSTWVYDIGDIIRTTGC